MKKKIYYLSAALSVIILGFFLQFLKYDVESTRFFKLFLNEYADTVVYLEEKDSNDSFLVKKSKSLKWRKEFNTKISGINEYAGSDDVNGNKFLLELYNRFIRLSMSEAMSEQTVKNELLKDKLISDVYHNKAELGKKTGFFSGLKNGLLIGFSYPVSAKDKFINLSAEGESVPSSLAKAYFVTIKDHANVSLNVFLFNGPAYKAGYLITWLISTYFTVILIFLPVFLIKPEKKSESKTTYGF